MPPQNNVRSWLLLIQDRIVCFLFIEHVFHRVSDGKPGVAEPGGRVGLGLPFFSGRAWLMLVYFEFCSNKFKQLNKHVWGKSLNEKNFQRFFLTRTGSRLPTLKKVPPSLLKTVRCSQKYITGLKCYAETVRHMYAWQSLSQSPNTRCFVGGPGESGTRNLQLDDRRSINAAKRKWNISVNVASCCSSITFASSHM